MDSNVTNEAIGRVLLAIRSIQSGKMVIMTDDQDRENEGDLVIAAEDITADKINFMATEARGLICLPLEASIIDRLQLPMMANTGGGRVHMKLGTAFTVSIEARRGVTTGISAADRAETVRVAIGDKTKPEDISVPGHVFPLKACSGGVLERTGHTEGSVDLARLSGKKPAAVICEIMNSDGSMARSGDLAIFSKKHGIPLLSVADLITYRLSHESLVSEIKRRSIKSFDGQKWWGVWFQSTLDKRCHFALVKGQGDFQNKIVDVRVQKQNPLAELLSSQDFPGSIFSQGRSKIEYFLDVLKSSQHGVLLFLSNSEKDAFLDVLSSNSMDPNLYGLGAQILKYLGVKKMRLHSSSDRQLSALKGFDLEVAETVLIPNNHFMEDVKEVSHV